MKLALQLNVSFNPLLIGERAQQEVDAYEEAPLGFNPLLIGERAQRPLGGANGYPFFVSTPF